MLSLGLAITVGQAGPPSPQSAFAQNRAPVTAASAPAAGQPAPPAPEGRAAAATGDPAGAATVAIPADSGGAPPAPVDAAGPCGPATCSPALPRWQTPLPRPGYFLVPPAGSGYYSALDQILGNYRDAPPKYAYPRVGPMFNPFYDADWTYLLDPTNTSHDYADALKWIPVADGVTFTTGGEVRYRFQNDVNSNGRLTGVADAYSLYRVRAYGDLWVQDWLRFYGEFLYADYGGRTLPPLPTDADRSDILDLFADLRVFEFDANPVYLRVGRQELLYGSQRLISPPDWANTRRTFQGVKAFTRTADWDFDVFAVQPVAVQPNRLDPTDHNQWFSGAWFTYRPAEGQAVDLYVLNLDNDTPGGAVGFGKVKGTSDVSTVGSRYAGTAGGWMWDAEGMLQCGSFANQSIRANAYTLSGGYNFKDVPWSPQFWVGYDHASGDPNPGATGTRETFNQLFPFGHYYFGFVDLVGRQNINDFVLQGAVYPENWVTCVVQFHAFRLDEARDALYGPAGNVVRQDKTGRAGTDVGDEVDLVTNLHLTTHSDVLVGYSRLFAGSFLANTVPAGTSPAKRAALNADPSVFYVQYSYRW
jgi:hypothetical protein